MDQHQLTRSSPSSALPSTHYWFLNEQNLTLQTLVTILNSTKATEIPAVVKSLSQESQDTLMKYLYKGMSLQGSGDVSGSVLLGWHEKVRFPFPFLQLSLPGDTEADGCLRFS